MKGEWVKDWVWETAESDDKGNPLIVMDTTFHADGSLEVYKMDAVYSDGGLVLGGTNYDWSEELKDWIPSQKAQLTYDDQGNVISQYTELWKMVSGSLVLNIRINMMSIGI